MLLKKLFIRSSERSSEPKKCNAPRRSIIEYNLLFLRSLNTDCCVSREPCNKTVFHGIFLWGNCDANGIFIEVLIKSDVIVCAQMQWLVSDIPCTLSRVLEQHKLNKDQWEERIQVWHEEHRGMIR